MIQPVTLVSGGICLAVIWLRYRSIPKTQRKGDPRRVLKTAKILTGAIFALMAITYAMRSLGERLDGALPHEPSLMERIVLYFAN